MQSPVNASIILGGDIETVGKLSALPTPLFPSKEISKTKGIYIDVPPNNSTYSKIITCNVDVEFASIAMSATGYLFPDYWEFTIGTYKIFETIYTKELPQTIVSGNTYSLVYAVPANTVMRIDFKNASATSKQVFFDLKVLVGKNDISNLNLTVS